MPTQNHIHLSTTIGSAPENAPDTYWIIKGDGGWQPKPHIIASQRRSLTGKLLVNTILDDEGEPVQLMDYDYVIRVDEYGGLDIDERYDLLLSLRGKRVYLVDVMHPNDGEDHAGSVRSMYVESIGNITPVNNLLQRFYVGIKLMDDTI